MGFPGGSVVKNPPANTGDARDVDSIPGLGRSPGEGNGNLLQNSCLGNPMDKGAWWATVNGVTKESNMTERLTTTIHLIYTLGYRDHNGKTDRPIQNFSSVQFRSSVMSNSLRPHESQHVRPPCPSPTPGLHSNSCPSSW